MGVTTMDFLGTEPFEAVATPSRYPDITLYCVVKPASRVQPA
jgi:hypothetical protein